MKILIASVQSFIFLFLAAIHVYWGLGGKIGSSVSVLTTKNKPVFKPGEVQRQINSAG